MLANRSIPRATVIPVLAYPDVNQAAAWLCDAFGFSVRLRIGAPRFYAHLPATKESARRICGELRDAVIQLGQQKD